MPFLARDKLKERATAGLFEDGDFDLGSLQQCSYDLRLGEEVYLLGRNAPERLSDRRPYLSLAPGQFALLTSYERLNMPADLLGFITIRATYKMQGLVNISGFHVDPTFRGRLVFSVQNAGATDIKLRYRERMFAFFADNIEGNIGEPRTRRQDGIALEHVQALGGSSISLMRLQKELQQLKVLTLAYAPLAIGAFVALLVALAGC